MMAALAQERGLRFEQIVGQPRGLPQLPPQGAWGEIINVTSRWVVIQNHSGQQYPIGVDQLGEFLVRWPSSVDALGPESVVEATGQNFGGNIVQTVHVDVFEGPDRSLVTPTYSGFFPSQPGLTTIDAGLNVFLGANNLGLENQFILSGWAYPAIPVMDQAPGQLHVVGTVVEKTPLRVNVPGNNVVTIVPVPGERFTVTRVTRGAVNHIQKGDYAFLMPQEITPRGLVLSQFILYKTVPFPLFNPNPVR
jgi:hypothetical protein